MSSTIATDRAARRATVSSAASAIAAAGDIHYGERADDRERAAAAFGALEGRVDLILLAGDLTTHGEPEQAQIVADVVRDVEVPVLTVLGNHDWHVNRAGRVPRRARGRRRDRARQARQPPDPRGLRHRGRHRGREGLHGRLPRLAPAGLRRAVAARRLPRVAWTRPRRSTRACARSRCARSGSCCCTTRRPPRRSSASARRSGRSWAPTGSRRRSSSTHPDMVLHGHAHAGTFEGRLGEVPVYNVSVPVLGEDFWVFELAGDRRRVPSEIPLGLGGVLEVAGVACRRHRRWWRRRCRRRSGRCPRSVAGVSSPVDLAGHVGVVLLGRGRCPRRRPRPTGPCLRPWVMATPCPGHVMWRPWRSELT